MPVYPSPKAQEQERALREEYSHAARHIGALYEKLENNPYPEEAEPYGDSTDPPPSGGSKIGGGNSFFVLDYRVQEAPYGYHILYRVNPPTVDLLSITTLEEDRNSLWHWVRDFFD